MKTGETMSRKNPFSVTIGSDFAPPPTAPPSLNSGADVQNQITRLTNAAQQYLKNGQSALAFDSLMEAYLLDPLDARVVSCEKAVLPAWENYRRQHAIGTAPTRVSDDERLARLKAEREAQRTAKERQMWEQASSKPRFFGNKETPSSTKR
ncbi:MAG TPA: hypothetical protein VLT13_09205 [Bacteroidota bacterium]|nr:hypothetical protein [Bacteroidota bacterium]